MPNENKGPSGAPGQQKSHVATRVNPATGQQETKTFTQEEWRNRDKSEGWNRPEGDDEASAPSAEQEPQK